MYFFSIEIKKMLLFFIFYLIGFLIVDCILDYYGWVGIYFFLHAIHNASIGFLTFPSVKRIFFQDNDDIDKLLSPSVCGMTYALHIYHIVKYYHTINTAEKIHHTLSLAIVIPLSYIFFENHDF